MMTKGKTTNKSMNSCEVNTSDLNGAREYQGLRCEIGIYVRLDRAQELRDPQLTGRIKGGFLLQLRRDGELTENFRGAIRELLGKSASVRTLKDMRTIEIKDITNLYGGFQALKFSVGPT